MSRSERLHEIEAQKIAETQDGIKLDDGTVQAWCAKQHVEDNRDGTFTLPEWVAKDKGFI
jgi:hypothetical protein